MKNMTRKKLSVRANTIALLTPGKLALAIGGAPPVSLGDCTSPTASPRRADIIAI